MMRLALYQPDIPQNTGTIMRLCACMGVALDIIEPCGFIMNEKKLRRAAMDYIDDLDFNRYPDWDTFYQKRVLSASNTRLVLMTTKASDYYHEFSFSENDILLAGQESAGVPDHIHDVADGRILIPMKGKSRSLNVAVSCAMVLGEGLRQVGGLS